MKPIYQGDVVVHLHYSRRKREKQMNEVIEIAKISDDMIELREHVRIENTTDNPLVDAYNQGIDAMYGQIQNYLNKLALQKAFGGKQ